MIGARIAGARAAGALRALSWTAALATWLGLGVPALAKDPVGGDLLVRLPEGRGERVMRSQVLDGGEGRAEYLAAGDVADLLRATSYWRSETRKLLLRMGDHRLTATVDNPFLILDGAIGPAVAEITIASNLTQMFATLEPASDLRIRRGIDSPTLLVPEMMVASA